MVAAIIPAGAPGIASFQNDDGYFGREVRSGDTPTPTKTISFPQNTNLPIYSVVDWDPATGIYIPAVAGTNAPSGILTAPVVTGAGVTTTADVYVGGMFNPDALSWPASFSTDALRKRAFETGKSPMILIQKPTFEAPV